MTICDMRPWSDESRDDIVRCWTHKVMLYEGDTREGFCPAGYYERLYEVAKRRAPLPADPAQAILREMDAMVALKRLEKQGALLADATLRIASALALVDATRGSRTLIDTPSVKTAADIAVGWYDQCASRGWLPAREVSE